MSKEMDMLKKSVKNKNRLIPDGYDDRLRNLLESLPDEAPVSDSTEAEIIRRPVRISFRPIVSAAAAFLIVATGVFALRNSLSSTLGQGNNGNGSSQVTTSVSETAAVSVTTPETTASETTVEAVTSVSETAEEITAVTNSKPDNYVTDRTEPVSPSVHSVPPVQASPSVQPAPSVQAIPSAPNSPVIPGVDDPDHPDPPVPSPEGPGHPSEPSPPAVPSPPAGVLPSPGQKPEEQQLPEEPSAPEANSHEDPAHPDHADKAAEIQEKIREEREKLREEERNKKEEARENAKDEIVEFRGENAFSPLHHDIAKPVK